MLVKNGGGRHFAAECGQFGIPPPLMMFLSDSLCTWGGV